MTVGGLTRTYTDIQLYNMPMAFRSLAEVDHVRATMDQMLLDGLEERGFVSFGIAEVGFAYAMSQERIATLEEVRAQKVWVPDGDEGAARSLESFGITPIPLSIADVLGGLQTGLIDAVRRRLDKGGLQGLADLVRGSLIGMAPGLQIQQPQAGFEIKVVAPGAIPVGGRRHQQAGGVPHDHAILCGLDDQAVGQGEDRQALIAGQGTKL